MSDHWDEFGRDVVAPNTRPVIEVGSKERLSGVVFDCTAVNAQPVVHASGSDWRVREVGFHGAWGGRRTDDAAFVLDEQGGKSLVHHVYLGDGAASDHSTGMLVHSDSAGDGSVLFRECHVDGFSDCGLYTTGAPSGIETLVRDSYFANNGVANLRLRSGEVEHCAIHNDKLEWPGDRAIFAKRPGPVNVDDCEMRADTAVEADNAVVNLTDTTYEGSIVGDDVTEALGAGPGDAWVTRYSNNVPQRAIDAATGEGVSL